jgi:hypothetical protein
VKHLVEADDDAVAEWMIRFVGPDADRRAQLTDIIGRAARQMAPNGEPPSDGASATAWEVLVDVADRLNGSGAVSLGRLDFISDVLLDELRNEARTQRPDDSATRRMTGPAGDALAALAASRQLREAVADALGFRVEPTWDAIYEYDPPGSHVRTHVDSRDYEIVYHLLLEHDSPTDGAGESVLIAHLPGGRGPARLSVRSGDSLVLRGRGTIHSWKPLGEDERRTLIAIGFQQPRRIA